MAQIYGKQLADTSVTGAKLVANTVTASKVASDVIVAAGTNPFTADQSLGGFKLTSVADPTAAQDAATKAYVDAVANGLDVKASVRLASAAALPANTRTGNVLTADANGALSVDSVAVANGNRVLVKDESTGANNGIYTVTDLGSAGTPFILTRATDADVSAEVTAGMFTFIAEGTVNADTGWVLTTNDTITLNTTALAFSQFSSTGTILAGAGLLKTGQTIDLVIEGSSGGLTANADNLQVNYGTTTELANVDAAAESAGTSQLLARADHKHALSVGSPVAVGTANADGTSISAARADHVHDTIVAVTGNKNMTASVTTTDNDSATATTVSAANGLAGYIGLRVNGIHYLVGDGTKTSVDAYISGDGGTTARAFSAVASGDTIRWNGSIAGFQLAATDRIDLDFSAF